VSVTESPSPVRIDTVSPLVGTEPANATSPPIGATTAVPDAAPMSMPRCWPAAYGCAGSNEKPVTTGPTTGHVHAPAEGTKTAKSTTTTASARTTTPFCCQDGKRALRRVAGASAVVNLDYSERR
jgi:hypothetical protein